MSDTPTETTSGETVTEKDMEAYNADDPLVDLLVPGAKIKILLALMRLRGDKLNPAGLCERASVDRGTWYRHRDDLIDTYGVVEEADQAGNSPLYRVDMEHPIIKRLAEIRELAGEQRHRATSSGSE